MAIGILALSALAGPSGCSQPAKRTEAHASAPASEAGRGVKLSGRGSADVQFALGRSLESAGKVAEAEAAYRVAIKNDPGRGDAHARLAVLLGGRGAFKESSTHFDAAIRRAPKDPELLCDRGYSLYLQRRWADAEASLRKAVAIDPKHARSHTNLGLVLARQGKGEAAVAEFAKAGCDPADARANLGLMLAMDGRLREADRAYADALAARPGSPSASAREGSRLVAAALARDGSADRRTGVAAATAPPIRDEAVRRTSGGR